MGALVKTVPESRQLSYFRFELEDGCEVSSTPNKMGVHLKNPKAVYAIGKQRGEALESSVVMANQTVELNFGKCSPRQYEVLLSVNPKLCANAQVSAPSMLPVGEENELKIIVSAFKQIDLKDFPYIMTLSLID